MKIGILQADSVLEQFQPDHGDYPEMFQRILSAAASAPLEFSIYNVEAGEYPADMDECDGYVITGSRRSVYEDDAWIKQLADYVVALHKAQKKTVGICFGHQMMALALGGKTEAASVGWGVGVQHFKVTDQQAFMEPALDEICLICSHKDQVTQLPEGAEVFAVSDYCPVAGFTVGNHFLAFQGHPEFVKGYSRDLMDMREEILGAETYQQGVASLQDSTDELAVAKWMLNFIAEASQEDAAQVEAPRGFAGARQKAGELLNNRGQLSELLQKAIDKSKHQRTALAEVWDELMAMIRMLRAWVKGDYRDVSSQAMLLVVTAVLYFVTPLDVIPDFIVALGFVDDAAIVAYVLGLVKSEIDKFKQWELQSSTNVIRPEDNPFHKD